MATTNATLTINSDIMDYPIAINKTMQMKKLQSTAGLEETTGLRTKKFESVSAVSIIAASDFTSGKASKVYIRNTGSDSTKFFYVAKNASAAASDTAAVTIGKLHGGEWMLIPWLADVNITVAPSSAEVMTLEYIVFEE